MKDQTTYDVIIIGGSYSGLAAGMALGRALKNVLIIDSGKPCNRQTPHSHNLLTQDGKTPGEISSLAKIQVTKYETISFFEGHAIHGSKKGNGFVIETKSGETFLTKKLIFATGIRDLTPPIEGIAECWGITVIHCPYCHGYEVKNDTTGILANGDGAMEFATLISNWTKDLTVFTNGKSTLSAEQAKKLQLHNIRIIEKEIASLYHRGGQLQQIIFKDGTSSRLKALYVRSPFEQHCDIPRQLGCDITEEGFIRTDGMQATTVPGVFACGDNATRLRTLANAISTGTTAGIMASREIIFGEF